jgi:hypothetical protein
LHPVRGLRQGLLKITQYCDGLRDGAGLQPRRGRGFGWLRSSR